jgi:hypothetical protein
MLFPTNDRISQNAEIQKHANIMQQQNFLINQHPSSGIARTGLGEFPITSLSETELFEKFAVPQAEIIVQGYYHSLRDIQTFSGVNLDLSGIIRSLDFLLLFDQAKRRRKIKSVIQLVRSIFNCHVPIVPKFLFRWDPGMTINPIDNN